MLLLIVILLCSWLYVYINIYMLQLCVTWKFRVKRHWSFICLSAFTGNLHSFRHCIVTEQRTRNRLKEQLRSNAEKLDKSCRARNGGHSMSFSILHTPHSALHIPHSTFHTLHYTLHTPHSILHPPYSTFRTPHSILHTPHSTLHTHASYSYLALGGAFTFSDLEREFAIGSSYLSRTNPDPRAQSIQIWLADIKCPHILRRISGHMEWLISKCTNRILQLHFVVRFKYASSVRNSKIIPRLSF